MATLNQLVDAAYANSREHGFWDETYCTDMSVQQERVWKTVPEKLMLIVSEAAEALEDYREGKKVTSGKWIHMTNHTDLPDLPEYICKGCHKEIMVWKLICECGFMAKPVGFPSELADIVIRVFDLAGALGINLEQEVLNKMAYNKSRPHKHGKVC